MDQYHHKNLRSTLIEKGIELVHEEGITSFSLRKIAAACQVSHAAPYSHFHNKEELLEAMQQYITDQFTQTLQQVLQDHKNNAKIMDDLVRAYLAFFLHHPHYFSFLFHQSRIVIDLSENADHAHNYPPFELYRTTLLSLLNQVHYPKDQQKDVVIAMWSFVHGITALATMDNVISDEDWEQKISDYMNLFACTFFKQQENRTC